MLFVYSQHICNCTNLCEQCSCPRLKIYVYGTKGILRLYFIDKTLFICEKNAMSANMRIMILFVLMLVFKFLHIKYIVVSSCQFKSPFEVQYPILVCLRRYFITTVDITNKFIVNPKTFHLSVKFIVLQSRIFSA